MNNNINPFEHNVDLITWELNTINAIIDRMDNFARVSKNWSILIWAGVISIALGKDLQELRASIILMTSIIPLLFWYMDSFFRTLQRRSIYRQIKIAEYLNSEEFATDCASNKFTNFKVLDPTGFQYRKDLEYKKFVSQKMTMKFKEVSVFYLGLIFASIFLSAVLWLLS